MSDAGWRARRARRYDFGSSFTCTFRIHTSLPRLCCWKAKRWSGCEARRQRDDERATASERAGNEDDIAAEEPRELACQRETEARAPAVTRRRRIRSPEGFEDPVVVLGGDPRAGIRHFEEHACVGTLPLGSEREDDVALLGELHGVGEEVDENLTHLSRVGVKVHGLLRFHDPEA